MARRLSRHEIAKGLGRDCGMFQTSILTVFLLLLSSLSLVLILTGCGRKGDLFLPEPSVAETNMPAVTAPDSLSATTKPATPTSTIPTTTENKLLQQQ